MSVQKQPKILPPGSFLFETSEHHRLTVVVDFLLVLLLDDGFFLFLTGDGEFKSLGRNGRRDVNPRVVIFPGVPV